MQACYVLLHRLPYPHAQALGGDLTSLATAGLLVGEALLGFFFAAAALELAVKKDVVKLYGTSGSLVDEQ